MDTAVLIIEDSELSLRRLETAVAEIPGLKVVGSAPSPKEAIALAKAIRPEIMILDILLTDGTGIDVLQRLREDAIEVKVIVVTNAPSPALGNACRNLGARFFFDKTMEFDQFQAALRQLQQETAIN